MSLLLHNARLLDPRCEELIDGVEILIEGEHVKEVSRPDGPVRGPLRADGAMRLDLGGRTVMPGLIDAHVHIFLTKLPLAAMESMPLTLMAVNATVLMRSMLMRGFTTVRDTAGGDFGIKAAVDAGLVEAPRLFISGMAMSQTGGHGDFRRKTQDVVPCHCCSGLAHMSRIVDGVPEMLKAVREELRKGADHIKLMVSGGVASPSDPLDSLQFRLDEIEAACTEAKNWGKYVSAHAYTSEAVSRAVRLGVRTIEHGNLIDEPTAKLMAEKGAYLVPTLVTYDAMARRGKEMGLPAESQAKNEEVRKAGLRSLDLAKRAGVPIGFGTDLLGPLHEDQSRELIIRSAVERPIDTLRSATLVNAVILNRAGKPGEVVVDALGELVPGACADLLVLEGNPLRDLGLIQDQGARLELIMKGGRVFKNSVTP